MKMRIPFFCVLLSALILSACGTTAKAPEETPAAKKSKAGDVQYRLDWKAADGAVLSAGEAELLAHIQTGVAFDRKLITDLLIAKQIKISPMGSAQIQPLLEKLATAQTAAADVFAAKEKYEAALKELLGKEVKYNRNAVTLGHLAARAEMQCYAGTMLQQILWRQLPSFGNANAVVIFTHGHILPGFMVKAGEAWNLVGIETTVAGRAELPLGPVALLQGPITVVDAELFALTEIFKGKLAEPKRIAQQAVTATATKYGLDLKKTGSGSTGDVDDKAANASIFAFGEPQTAAGSFARPSVAILDRTKMATTSTASENIVGAIAGDKNRGTIVFDKAELSVQLRHFPLKQTQEYVLVATVVGRKETVVLRLPFAKYYPEIGPALAPADLLPLEFNAFDFAFEAPGAKDKDALFPIIADVTTKDGQRASLMWNSPNEPVVRIGAPLGKIHQR